MELHIEGFLGSAAVRRSVGRRAGIQAEAAPRRSILGTIDAVAAYGFAKPARLLRRAVRPARRPGRLNRVARMAAGFCCALAALGCGQDDREAEKRRERDRLLLEIGELRARIAQLERSEAERTERIERLAAELAEEKNTKSELARELDRISARSMGDKFDVDGLMALMRNPDPEISRSAIFIARKTGDERLFHALATLARGDRDPNVRRAAAEALGNIPHPDARKALVDILFDPVPSVASTAAYGLASSRDPDTVPQLLRALNSIKTPDTKTAASEARAAFIDALGRLGDRRAVPALIEHLNSPNESIRMSALGALRNMADESVGPAITAWLKSQPQPKAGESAAVHAAALQILAAAGDRSAGPVVIPMLESQNSQLAEAACAALHRVCGPSSVDMLLRALKREQVVEARGGSYQYLSAVIRALGQTGSPKAASALLDIASSGHVPAQLAGELAAALRSVAHPAVSDKLVEAHAKLKEGRLKAEIQRILSSEEYPVKYDEASKAYKLDAEALRKIRDALPKDPGGGGQDF